MNAMGRSICAGMPAALGYAVLGESFTALITPHIIAHLRLLSRGYVGIPENKNGIFLLTFPQLRLPIRLTRVAERLYMLAFVRSL